MKNERLDPIYQKAFVGIWKNKSKSLVENLPIRILAFNEDGTFTGGKDNMEGTVNGDVDDVSTDDGDNTHDRFIMGTISLSIREEGTHRRRRLSIPYVLTKNAKFDNDFDPIPGTSKQAPKYNQLDLKINKNTQTFAFVSHLPGPVLQPSKIKELEY